MQTTKPTAAPSPDVAALATDIARVAGCQVGSERTRRIVAYILETLSLQKAADRAVPFGFYFWRSNGDGTSSPDFAKGAIPSWHRDVRDVTPLYTLATIDGTTTSGD